MTLREQAKQVIRKLAATDYAMHVWRDGLREQNFASDSDEHDACRVLGHSAYSVWLAAWREIERAELQRRFPTAFVLLELWERPWSTSALRFAMHRIAAVASHGLPMLRDTFAEELQANVASYQS